MKKVSCKMFFTVLWRGICQVLGWFFGLFGYKRDGKFAKCVWGVFSVSAAIVMAFIACAAIYAGYENLTSEFRYKKYLERRGGEYISRTISYIPDYNGTDGYLFNKRNGRKVLKGIDWIAKPLGNDSLVCFSNGSKRGYFNRNTGETVIPAQYTHAWVFSEGIAAVEENGIIKFIDSNGNQVFDRTVPCDPGYDGYVFHGGYCILDEDNDGKFGLMDRTGVTVLPEEYDNISVSCNLCFWTLTKENEQGIIDKDLNPVVPMMVCNNMFLFDDGIDVTMEDNTMRKYDLQGNLIDDFYITDFEYLEYEQEETCQYVKNEYNEYKEEFEIIHSKEHKTARARLAKYTAGRGKDGLMTQDGHAVTLPKYEYIQAIGPDLYLCTASHGDKEILNGKGQKVK